MLMRKYTLRFGVVLAVLCAAGTSVAETQQILLLSDAHLDIYYGTSKAMGGTQCHSASTTGTLGTLGCDSPLTLLESAVADMKAHFGNVSFSVFTGDWVRHDMHLQPQGTEETINLVGGKLLGKLPGRRQPIASPGLGSASSSPNKFSKVAAALGNNDLQPDYYFAYDKDSSSASSKMSNQEKLMKSFSSNMQNISILESTASAGQGEGGSSSSSKTSSTTTITQFEKCGFYKRTLNQEKLVIIVLNSLLWSAALEPKVGPKGTDPCGQFHFLESALEAVALQQAQGWRTYIVGHIPPIINTWQVLTTGHAPNSTVDKWTHFWTEYFIQRYQDLLLQYRHVISAQFYGHTHKFTFVGASHFNDTKTKRSSSSSDADGWLPPLFVIPALSPVFYNSPSYLVATIDQKTKEVLDLKQRSFDLIAKTWSAGGVTQGDVPPVDDDGFRATIFGRPTRRGVAPSSLPPSPISSSDIAFAGCKMLLNFSDEMNDLTLATSSQSSWWRQYLEVYNGGIQGKGNPFVALPGGHCESATCRRVFSCAARYMLADQVTSCLRESRSSINQRCMELANHGLTTDRVGTNSDSSASGNSTGQAAGVADEKAPRQEGSVAMAALLLLCLFGSTFSTFSMIHSKRRHWMEEQREEQCKAALEVVTQSVLEDEAGSNPEGSGSKDLRLDTTRRSTPTEERQQKRCEDPEDDEEPMVSTPLTHSPCAAPRARLDQLQGSRAEATENTSQ